MLGYMSDAIPLVAPDGGNVAKRRVPTSRDAAGDKGHDFLLYRLGEERRDLGDTFVAHQFARVGLGQPWRMEVIVEDMFHLLVGVIDHEILLAHEDGRDAPLVGDTDKCLAIRLWDSVDEYHLAVHDAARAIGGDIPVDQMLNRP